ncbi:unnamed protein product, partial [Polarella glacialis]
DSLSRPLPPMHTWSPQSLPGRSQAHSQVLSSAASSVSISAATLEMPKFDSVVFYFEPLGGRYAIQRCILNFYPCSIDLADVPRTARSQDEQHQQQQQQQPSPACLLDMLADDFREPFKCWCQHQLHSWRYGEPLIGPSCMTNVELVLPKILGSRRLIAERVELLPLEPTSAGESKASSPVCSESKSGSSEGSFSQVEFPCSDGSSTDQLQAGSPRLACVKFSALSMPPSLLRHLVNVDSRRSQQHSASGGFGGVRARFDLRAGEE